MNYLVSLFVLCFCFIAQATEKSTFSWTPQEILHMKSFSDIQLSPDHQMVLFVSKELTANKESFFYRVYKSDTNGNKEPIPFTQTGSSAFNPRWSPDGQWIAFLSTRNGIPNLFVIRSDGGEASSLTHVKSEIQNFRWSPDGQKIAFVMADDAHSNTYLSSPYQYQEEKIFNRLWIIDLASPELGPIALSPNFFHVRGNGDFGSRIEEFDWSPDSKKILFAYSPSSSLDHYYLDSSLAIIDVSTGEISSWEKKARYEALPRFSPDGKFVAYLSSDASKSYGVNRTISLRSSDGTYIRTLPATYNEGPFLVGPSLIGWTPTGQHVLFFEPKKTRFQLALLPIDGGKIKEITHAQLHFSEPCLSQDGTRLAFVGQHSSSPPEIYISKSDLGEVKQLTHLNRTYLNLPQPKTEIVHWNSKDGWEIEGLLTYPLNYDPKKNYPLLLVIHGGPMSFFDETFVGAPSPYPLASFAEAGFFLFRPNPRGSCGYGGKFRAANYGDWGGKDYEDIMTGVDALIAKGLIDQERMGVMGWSYGGYMTAWVISQSNRFKAASIGAGLSNLISMSGTTDLHRLLPDYFLGDFWQKPQLYEERSPIYYVSKITTPCLIQHGLEDQRVPVSQAYEFHHALERAGKQNELILYPGMGHRLSTPEMLYDAMVRNLSWFQKHLM